MTKRLTPAFFLFALYAAALMFSMQAQRSKFDEWNQRAVPFFLQMGTPR